MRIFHLEKKVINRLKQNRNEKEQIARYAASLISDNDFIYIDAGTTTELLIDYIEQRRNVTFVTNGISHAKKLTQAGFRVHILGGEFKLETEAIVGEEAMLLLDKYNFTKRILGDCCYDNEDKDITSGFFSLCSYWVL